MGIVQNTIEVPGQTPARATVTVQLVGGPGFETDDTEIAGSQRPPVDVLTGEWQINLVPNSEITPANTHYRVTETIQGFAKSSTWDIVVPTGAGPFDLRDILVTPLTGNSPLAFVEPNLRTATPSDWPERVFSTDDAVCPATALTFEHGKAVARGSGAGTGVRSNRRSVFMVPGSPGGYSRIRSRISGSRSSGTLVPQWGHMHGVGVAADGNRYGVLVWTDIITNVPVNLHFGIWRASDGPAGSFLTSEDVGVDRAAFTDGSRTANVVTLTGLPAGHGFVVGDQIVTDAADNGYDGVFELSAVGATTVTYSQNAADDASAGAGNIRLSSQAAAAFRADRTYNVTDAVRTSNTVTATLATPVAHPIVPGDVVTVDLADATYDGIFVVRTTVLNQVTWRQEAADDASAGAGTINKRLPYFIESEWRAGLLRARCWPDAGFGAAPLDGVPQAGAVWAAPPPWESNGSFTAKLTGLANPEPDPAFGEGCAVVAAHMAAGSTITEVRYDNIQAVAIA